jgi:hypothetical protein
MEKDGLVVKTNKSKTLNNQKTFGVTPKGILYLDYQHKISELLELRRKLGYKQLKRGSAFRW